MNNKKKNINDNLNDIDTVLSKIDKTNPFVVPDDYFDNLPLIIQEKCIKKNNISSLSKIIEYFLIPKHSISLAFGMALIIVSSIFVFNNFNIVSSDTLNNSLSYIENIIKEDYDVNNIDESLIVETLLSEIEYSDISNIQLNTNDVNTDNIIDYLSDNIDENDLAFNF